MTDERYKNFVTPKQLDVAIEKGMGKHFNGKIDALHKIVQDHNETHNEHMEKQSAFMKEMEPVITGFRTILGLRRFIVWIATPISILGATWLAIKGYLIK
jgi:hypothetical protein